VEVLSHPAGVRNLPTGGRVLIVDCDAGTRRELAGSLTAMGHTVVEASSQAEASRVLLQVTIDVVLLDLPLQDGGGLELLTSIGAAHDSTGVVVLSSSNADRDMRESLRRGAMAYLRKPTDPLTLEAQLSVALGRVRGSGQNSLARVLEQLPVHLTKQLTRAWDLRHVETGAHIQRMAEASRRLALALGASESEAGQIGRMAVLHDIGKIAIPDAVLSKPDRLTDEEFVVMKRHSEIGGEMLSGWGHPFLDLAAQVARSHHERWDGTGYPDGLVGEECLWQARLIGIVDVYDALGQVRCYKPSWSRQHIVDFFHSERGKSFDAEITDALLANIAELEQVKSEYPDPTVGASAVRLRVAATPNPGAALLGRR
jgi:cyclic di-GMP phosphodiesterase